MTNSTANVTSEDRRLAALRRWIEQTLGSVPELAPASADASFRRYFRLSGPGGATLIAMDAPPAHEDTARFVAVAELMRAAGLHVPLVHRADPEQGFALLSDLGTQTYLDAIGPANADGLIDAALEALVRLQAATRDGALPRYDAAVLQHELDLFPDWYVRRHRGMRPDKAWTGAWRGLCERLIAEALAQPKVYVHRDYILRNLMVSDPCPGVIDFQDALLGPIAYDVLTLFRDAFHSWEEAWIERKVAHYLELAREAGLPVPDEDRVFTRWFDLIGVQRHLKVIGIFARLAYRDGKPRYLAEVPRFLGYLRAVAPRYGETEALIRMLDGLEGD